MEQLNHLWSRDDKHIYCRNSRVMKADISTFKVLNAIFAKDVNYVFYIEGIAHDIDAPTFIPLDVGKIERTDSLYIDESRRWSYKGYGRDQDHVYFHDMMSGKPRVVKGADKDSFEVLDFNYARDKEHVYYYGIKVKEANNANFEMLNAFFSKDDNHVFYGGRVVPKVDPENFELIGDFDNKWSFWGKDKNYLVYQSELVARLIPL